jgi:hypothetical protein
MRTMHRERLEPSQQTGDFTVAAQLVWIATATRSNPYLTRPDILSSELRGKRVTKVSRSLEKLPGGQAFCRTELARGLVEQTVGSGERQAMAGWDPTESS